MRVLLLMFMILWANPMIAEIKTLKVAAYELDPYITEKGEEPGYLFEILQEAFRIAGYKIEIQFYPRQRARIVVESGERDILIPTYMNPQTKASLLFSLPLQGSQISYFKFKNAPSKKNPIIASAVDTNSLDPAIREKFKAALGDTLPVEKTAQLIDMLNLKRIDLGIADRNAAAQALGTSRPHLLGHIEFIDPPLLHKDFYLGFSKKNADSRKRLDDFNNALRVMQKSGRYQQILQTYGYRIDNSNAKVLNIITIKTLDMKIMEELSKNFEKSRPGVKINWISLEENRLRRRIATSIALNDAAFDIFTLGAFETPIYAAKKWIEPFTKLAADYDERDLLPMVRKTLSYEGKYYALPFYSETSLTYYRKDLFAKAGLSMPESPRYSDIVRFAEKLHDPARGLYGLCLRGKAGWGTNVSFLLTLVHTFGGTWFDESWKPQMTSQPFREAMAFYVDMVKRFGPPDGSKVGYIEGLELFASGHCAMWIDASVAASYIADPSKSQVSSVFGYAYSPMQKTEAGRQWNWAWAFAVDASSKKKQLAQEFIQWATSKEYIDLVAKEKGWVMVPPGTRISTYNPAYISKAPFSAFVLKAMQNYVELRTLHPKIPYSGYVFIEIPELPAIGTTLGNHMAEVLKDRETLDQALNFAQRDIRNIMYQSGYYDSAKGREQR